MGSVDKIKWGEGAREHLEGVSQGAMSPQLEAARDQEKL